MQISSRMKVAYENDTMLVENGTKITYLKLGKVEKM